MKKYISTLLSIVLSISTLICTNITSYANDCHCCNRCTGDYDCSCPCYEEECIYHDYIEYYCDCCDDCTGDEYCTCCDDCIFYNDYENYEDEDNYESDYEYEDDEDYDDEDEEDNPVDYGSDPIEKETDYTLDDMSQDLKNIRIDQSCGTSMLWYVNGTTLYIFGSGDMDDYTMNAPAPWSKLNINKVVIRKGINSIGKYAFYNSSIRKVELSSSISEIKEHAFDSCVNIIQVTLNMNLESIGDFAFANCENLKQVTLNNTLIKLGNYAFYNCYELNYIRFPNTLENIPYGSFMNCTNLKRLILREGLLSIEPYAFFNCSSIATIQLPTTLSTIENNAFNSCATLNEINFSNSVYEIKNNAFSNCRALTNVNFGKIISIGNEAFSNSGLTAVSIPKTLTTIGANIFKGCSLVSIDVNQNANAYKTFQKLTNASVVCKTHDNCSSTTVKSTFSTDGRINGTVCRACGYETSVKIIYQIKDITLSKTSVTYNGKTQMPTIKVVDRMNKTISDSNYNLTFGSGFKNVGTYTIKVTFKNNYSGSKTLNYSINPASTTISSLTATSKGFKASIKKQATQTTGYQIQYSTSSSFSSAKTITLNNNTTVSKSITGLSANKKYYVRIRTYKTVSGKNYYSSWSGYKSITTKK